MFAIRSQMTLESHKAMFLFIGEMFLDNTKILGEVYETYLEKNNIKENGDLYFYINLTTENTFG